MENNNEFTPETITLSGLVKSKTHRQKYLDKTSPADFAVKSHRMVFDAVVSLVQSTTDVNRDTLRAALSHDVSLQMVALLCFDNKIPDLDENIFNEFKQKGKRVRITEIANYINRGNQKAVDVDLMTEELRDRLNALDTNTAAVEVFDSDKCVDETQFILEQWANGECPVITGLPEVDEKMFLTQILGYWILAGESGAGKSAMMMTVAKNNALLGRHVTIASLEMSKTMLYTRMAMDDPLCAGLELTAANIKNANKFSNLMKATDRLRKLPIRVIEGVRNIFSIDRLARHIAINYGSQLFCFDYIQLGETSPMDKDVVRVSTVSRVLQSLTTPRLVEGYKGQPVFALSQYNGEGGKARSKGGQASNGDLAWSSQIQKDADGILHLRIESEGENETLVDVSCGKQRNYKSGWVAHTIFNKPRQIFETQLTRKQVDIRQSMPVRNIKF